MTIPALGFIGVAHRYGATQALVDFSLCVGMGEVVCLLGPSGCGKTTALRLAAGLETLQQGRIEIGGQVVATPDEDVPPERRGVGLVFQDYALFPHLTVGENVGFGLAGRSAADRRRRSVEMLERVQLGRQIDAYPHMLSGGQQQRVALARALAPSPRVLLMDEPFSGLDVRLRSMVRLDSLDILRAEGTAALIVTHDPEEAMALGDRIAVMDAGRVRQIGTAREIWDHPVDAFTAAFPGDVARFAGRVIQGGVTTPLGRFSAEAPDGMAVAVIVRADAIRPDPDGDGPIARVRSVAFLGGAALVRLELPGIAEIVVARVVGTDLDLVPEPGGSVALRVGLRGIFVFPA